MADADLADDVIWFRNHPHRRFRLRGCSEVEEYVNRAPWVLVCKTGQEMRTRIPVDFLVSSDGWNTEERCKALFEFLRGSFTTAH